MTSRTVIEAPAKLTLSLRITGVRPDGFHLIDAEMVALDLHDVLVVTARDDDTCTLEVDGPFAAGVPVDGTNLVHRALALAGRGADVSVTKNIPHGGGLGGGSTDAAAVLRWTGFSDATAASAIGADIPFCMHGGRARVRGIGELVEPLAFVPAVFTLVIPPLHVPTPAVYRAWDEMGGPRHDSGNDLEPAALRVEPRLAEWKRRITETTGVEPVLAGSGATWFVRGDHEHSARTIEGATVLLARTRADAGAMGPGSPEK